MAARVLLKYRLSHVLRSAVLASLLMSGVYAASPADEKPKDEQTKKETEPNALDKVKADEGELLQPKGSATKPTTKAAKPKMEVSAEARQLLDSVRDAYKELKSLQVAGTIVSDIDVNSEQTKNRAAFTATYAAPLMFRHETKESLSAGGEMVASQSFGGTGKKFYAFEPRYNYVYQIDAPTERTKSGDLPPQITGLLSQLNPSLLLAVVPDAAEELLDGVDKIEKVSDIKIDGIDYPALKLTFDKQAEVTFAFDPKSNLVRQVIWDRKAYALARKQADVKKVQIVVDYTKNEPGSEVKPEQFAWVPPVGARDVTSLADGGGAAEGEGDANAMLGKPAPDFKLKDLEGKEVKMSDLKGKVIVLDFWATWCGPCRASMPHLDEIYNDHKGDAFAAYAVNLREKNKEVKAFVEKTKLAMPVLMDTDGKVGNSFGVSGIPHTVVIDKEGKIVKVTIGAGTHDQIRAAVDEALK